MHDQHNNGYIIKGVIVHLDAIGSIIRKIDSSQKKVFYYVFSVGHPDYSTSPVPIAEIISSANSRAEITHFCKNGHLKPKDCSQ